MGSVPHGIYDGVFSSYGEVDRYEAYSVCRNLFRKYRRKYGRKALEEDILECRNILLYMRIE